MQLLMKYLSKELFKNKSIVAVIFLFALFTAFMYFFVHYSVDINLSVYQALSDKDSLSLAGGKYYTALKNNRLLIRNITIAMMGIFSFIVFLTSKNFIKENEKMMGQIIAMGYRGYAINSSITLVLMCLTLVGTLFGWVLGYFGSDILLEANQKTYLVEEVTKGIYMGSLFTGTLVLTMIIGGITYIAGLGIGNKEVSLMIKQDKNKLKNRPSYTERFIQYLPIRDKYKYKLTLKSGSVLFLILVAIVTFNIMFVLSVSLYFSGAELMESQTKHREYRYDIRYDELQQDVGEKSHEDLNYLVYEGNVIIDDEQLPYQIVGLDKSDDLFQLIDSSGEPIGDVSGIILNPELSENYQVEIGDQLEITINGLQFTLPVSAIGSNADLKTIYLPKERLENIVGVETGVYNGKMTMEPDTEGSYISFEEKLNNLRRELTSNRASAVINQSIGAITGCLLIYLAILIALNNNLRSLFIFDLLGYTKKDINKVLLNPYWGILNVLFILTLPIGSYVAKRIQIMTSIQTGDYMPFQINPLTIIYMFLILNLLYFAIRGLFVIKVNRMIRMEQQGKALYEW